MDTIVEIILDTDHSGHDCTPVSYTHLDVYKRQVLGEIPHMRYIDSFDVLEEPKTEPSFLLSQLPAALKERGLELSTLSLIHI